MRIDKYLQWRIILSAISFIFSALSFLFGLYLAVNGFQAIFVFISICYSLTTSMLLINAWRTGNPVNSRVAFFLAFSLSLILIIGSMDSRRISSLEWFLIGVVVPILNLNWIATKCAVGYKRKTGEPIKEAAKRKNTSTFKH